MPTTQQNEWIANVLGVHPNPPGAATGNAMQHDCKIVRGKVPGPVNHVLCETHHHVLDTNTHTIIAKDLAEYKKKFPAPSHSASHPKGHASPVAHGHHQATEPHEGKQDKPVGEMDEAGKKDESKSGGESKAEGGSSDGVAVAVLKWLVTKADDATLKAQIGSAMPDGKKSTDYQWKGPIKTIAEYPEEKSLLHLSTIAFAQVEISFYYSGKYINNFHATLTRADVDKTASLSAELTIDDSNVGNSPNGVAHLDWTITFRREHFMGSKLVTVTGRASGDGTYTTSQPSVFDMVQEAQQEGAAQVPQKS